MEFRIVKCSGYLKKVNDCKHIKTTRDSEGNIDGADYVWWDEEKKCYQEKQIEEFDGVSDFVKTYYKKTDKEFSGVIVGEKDIVASAALYADTNTDFRGYEYSYIGKQVVEVVKCAIVYYGNNRKRYVPLDCILETVKELKTHQKRGEVKE